MQGRIQDPEAISPVGSIQVSQSEPGSWLGSCQETGLDGDCQGQSRQGSDLGQT